MNLKAHEISRVVKELEKPLADSFFNKLFQVDRDEWVLELRKGPEKRWLLISVCQKNSRIHLVSGPPPDRISLDSFSRIMRKTLARRVMRRIRRMPGDRVVFLDFLAPTGEYTLAAELMGSSGNIYLIDPGKRVVAMAIARKSRNQLGQPYAPPPALGAGGMVADDLAGDETANDGSFAFNMELEKKLQRHVREERLADMKKRATSPSKAELKKLVKRKKSLHKEKLALEKHANDRRLGDLLQANFNQIKKGAVSLDVTDYYRSSSEKITVALDPSRSPQKNVEGYYRWGRKYEKGAPRIENEIMELETREKGIKAEIARIESAETIKDMKNLVPELFIDKPVAKKSDPARRQPSGPRKFVSSEGYTILVGRNDRENDEISLKTANGRDLWLHARDYPGSHVVVRLPKGAKPSRTAVEEGAMIALSYSKAAKSGKGEVTYCLAKNVRKPKGAAPGKVLVTGEKSIWVKIDPDRIRKMKL